MKGIDIFCASQAATAIRHFGMDEGSSSSSSSTIHLGGGSNSRAIDRYNPIIRDPRRISKPLPPSSSQPPKPHKNRKTSSKPNDNYQSNKNSSKPNDQKKKSIISDPSDNGSSIIRKSWSCTKPGDFISPPGSSRYLLSDDGFLDVLSNFDPVLALVSEESSKSPQVVKKDESSSASKPSSSSCSPDQVVVMRVSLHCKGCERKMRKHISRMEGVRSFNIDFAAKKLTVIGDVSPVEILASVSKVKNAQLWPPTISSSSLSSLASDHSQQQLNNYKGLVAI